MRFRQVVQLLDAAAKADTEPLAAAERDQRVRELVRLALRVALVPRIEVREDPLATPRRQPHQHREGADRGRDEAAEQLAVHTAEKQHAHRDRRDHHERAHVRLEQQQRTDRPTANAIGRKPLAKLCMYSCLRTV